MERAFRFVNFTFLKACSVKSAAYIMIEPVLLLVLKKLEVLRKSFSLYMNAIHHPTVISQPEVFGGASHRIRGERDMYRLKRYSKTVF